MGWDKMKCPRCGTENNDKRIVCKNCKTAFTPNILSEIEKNNKHSENYTTVQNNTEKPKNNKVLLGCGLIVLGMIFFLGGCAKLSDGGTTGMIIGGIMILSSLIPLTSHEIQKDNEDAQKKDSYNKINNIPYNASTIKKYNGEYQAPYNIWKDGESLQLVSTYNSGGYIRHSINISDIISYNIIGDAYTETNVTGGGSSLTGAVIGGAIAGGAGAVIGSRKKIETETKRIDKRKTVLTYNEHGTTKNMFFSPETYEILLQLIPDKDINLVKTNNSPSEVSKNKTDDVYVKIRELAKLKDDGILTEEEFIEKKKILLEKIG
jgi:hypothetical protein